ncbi:Dabb family protein [uncultured Tateyamaria sp.]|uniref:Dabb family protein n=1 Tax=uncultured Tateyamaria sp. TaxID=455651 RepID=UPI002612139E|nr:Dabb family protein [uncultured Tateyamaria sp.]
MIRHCVFLSLSPKADTAELDKIMLDLEDLVRRLDGCSGFRAGPNRDYEGKTPDYPYGFTLDAENAKALAAYAVDPEHQALGGRLVALCEGGADGIIVYDIEAPA